MRIVAIVPAYNEEAGIAETIGSLREQWCPVINEIIVVPNNCDDRTAEIARDAGVTVWEYPGHNPDRKAGALNWAISYLIPKLTDDDYVLITDADSRLVSDWTGHALRELRNSRFTGKPAGAACANFYISPDNPNATPILGSLQRNEYDRFARQVKSRGAAIVLSGVATLFEVRLIKDILSARGFGLPGRYGEMYHTQTATEDIELTFAVKKLGYRPLAPKDAIAYTDAMPTVGALSDQRERWQRGMLDSLKIYGVSRLTIGSWATQAVIYLGSVLTPAYLIFLLAVGLNGDAIPFDPKWLWLNLVFVAERFFTVKSHRFMAALLIPEWVYEQVRSVIYWKALIKTITGARLTWINAVN